MAESAVSSLLEKLAHFLQKELQPLKSAADEIASLKKDLAHISAFLRVADALQVNDEELKVWVKQVRDIAHDTEDLLDELSLLYSHDHGNRFNGPFHRISCSIRNMKARYRIASELKGINTRFKNILMVHNRLRSRYSLPEQVSSSATSADDNWQSRRVDAVLVDKSDLVGIDFPKKQLVGWLLEGSSAREVISVAGMGGLGKTTLAKQVYDDVRVKKHFELRVWTTVSMSSTVGDLLKGLVRQLHQISRTASVTRGIESMNDEGLKVLIKGLLQTRRYLIVLDDVWHLYEWDALRYVFPHNRCGSRVLVTSRNADVASTASMESVGKSYNLKPLPAAESWELFCRKTFQAQPCPSHLQEICSNIVRKCEGLPLAIIAISGVLATKDTRRIDEWDMVYRSLGFEIEENDKLVNMRKVLSLSYRDLPYYLKPCILYLSIFPKDQSIGHMRLIRLWVAEGFVEEKEGKNLEEVAEDYANELLHRNLIQVARTRSDGRVKSFRVHDIMRELIVFRSKDQNFATIVDTHNSQLPNRVRRLAIHDGTFQTMQQSIPGSYIRSLFISEGVQMTSLARLFSLANCKLLNVLDLRGTTLRRFPVEVVNLYHLKYLSLRNTKVSIIPRQIGKLQSLQTLDLKYTHVKELPAEISKLQRLRHLLVYSYKFEYYSCWKYGFKLQAEIKNLQSLQKLCFIEANEDGGFLKSELGSLSQLRRLGISKLKEEDGIWLCSSLERLSNLRALSVNSVEKDEAIDLQHLSSPPTLLQRLYLNGRLNTLPHWIPFLHSLMRLFLMHSRLQNDPLGSLQNLPNLAHLELLQAFDGNTLFFRNGGFKKLKVLGLDNFDKLKWVEVEEGAMPCLEKLIIQRCELLKEVPPGIQHLTKLNVLEFYDMPEELIKTISIKEQNNDYKIVEHIPEVCFSYWTGGGWDVYSLKSLSDGTICPQPSTVIKSHELRHRR